MLLGFENALGRGISLDCLLPWFLLWIKAYIIVLFSTYIFLVLVLGLVVLNVICGWSFKLILLAVLFFIKLNSVISVYGLLINDGSV